jgi:hypothetical protein
MKSPGSTYISEYDFQGADKSQRREDHALSHPKIDAVYIGAHEIDSCTKDRGYYSILERCHFPCAMYDSLCRLSHHRQVHKEQPWTSGLTMDSRSKHPV